MTQTPERAEAVAPELKRAVLSALLAVKDETGQVSAADIRRARLVLNNKVTERTLWRWVQRGEVPAGRRGTWLPNKRQQEMLLTWGTVAEVARQLKKEGEVAVTERTMQRGFQAEVGTVDRVYARSGYHKAQALTPTSALPDREVNEEWSMDDTQLPVWCIMPDGTVDKPVFQGIRDAGSKMIVGFNISPRPFNAEDAVENIAKAVAGYHNERGVFVGGKPRAMRTDRGSIFVARATGLGLVAAAVERRYSEAYNPQGNGGIERWHRTFKPMFRDVEGYNWTDYKAGDPRKAQAAPPKAGLLFYEEVVPLAVERVHTFNNERVHSTHGMTPMDCWERDVAANPHLVQRADPVALRAAMQQRETRKLNRRRIQHAGRFYNLHPQSVYDSDDSTETVTARTRAIRANEGRDVEVRFLHDRVEFVCVYTLQGEYLGDAVNDKYQTVEQAGETSRARRAHIKTFNAHLDRIAEAHVAGVAVRKAEARAEAGLHSHDRYDACDDTCDGVCAAHRMVSGDVAHGRPSESKKAGGSGKKTVKGTKKSLSNRPPTASERLAQRKRDDQDRMNAAIEARRAAEARTAS